MREASQEDIIKILEKAGFSKEKISGEEYKLANRWCKKYI